MSGRTLRGIILSVAFAAAVARPAVSPAGSKPYNGAEYRTTESYLYGRFEVRMKAIGRDGALASFFTYNDNYPATPWNEIDIEILGRYSDDVQFNTITPGQGNHVSHQYTAFDPAADFHVYAIEWTPTSVAWFCDSVEVYRQTGAHIATLNLPQKIMMNVWIPTNPFWVGSWNESVLPAFAAYDWVSYASYTPGTGSLGTGNSFTPQWLDNFDTWDQARWEKASHTFDGNNVDFAPANAVFQNGNLILCLTKPAAQGYTDAVPPAVLWARVEGDSIRLKFSEEVERISAEAASNYLLTRGSIVAAHLMNDRKTVLLEAPGIDTSTTATVIVRNVRDMWAVPNAMSPAATPLVRSTRLSFPVRINVGGNDTLGYRADEDWSPSVEYGKLDGQTSYHSGASIAGTNEQEIYRSEAFGMCEYKVRAPNGRYVVTLMMAENAFTSSGGRVMNIVVNGTQVETALDLELRAGFRAAYQRSLFVNVSDGAVTVHLQGLVDNALLNGITVLPIGTGVDLNHNASPLPERLMLFPGYPNPFNGGTTLRFTLPREDRLRLRIFDTLGRTVRVTNLGEFPAGVGEAHWDGRGTNGEGLPSGVYFCMIEGSTRSDVEKLVYMK